MPLTLKFQSRLRLVNLHDEAGPAYEIYVDGEPIGYVIQDNSWTYPAWLASLNFRAKGRYEQTSGARWLPHTQRNRRPAAVDALVSAYLEGIDK